MSSDDQWGEAFDDLNARGLAAEAESTSEKLQVVQIKATLALAQAVGEVAQALTANLKAERSVIVKTPQDARIEDRRRTSKAAEVGHVLRDLQVRARRLHNG